jgi:DnaJ-class molecular chaperone
MPDAKPVPDAETVNIPLDAAQTWHEAGPNDLEKTPTDFRRTYVELSCEDCGGSGVIVSSNSPCFACNALGYVRVAVHLPVEED